MHPVMVQWRWLCGRNRIHCSPPLQRALVEGLALGHHCAVGTPAFSSSHHSVGSVCICWVV
jgi:hypothetical protein